MTKEELQKHFQTLSYFYNNFRAAYPATKGGNAKTRKRADYEVDVSIMGFANYIRQDWELYKWITVGRDGDDTWAMKINFDELQLPRYFSSDVPEFLDKLEAAIKEADE